MSSPSNSTFSHDSADRIAQCAIHHYHTQLPTKAKPHSDTEWTVYVAIVATANSTEKEPWVVSCATGTKCTCVNPQQQEYGGCILSDCHAECLARRGLVRVLQQELLSLLRHKSCDPKDPRRLLEPCHPGSVSFQLRSDLQLHLYSSDNPCGDASIYPVQDRYRDHNAALYTGAKVVVMTPSSSLEQTNPTTNTSLLEGTTVAREAIQQLGKLRTKSGRSNLPSSKRSTSHSCSDKIVKWGILGLQGCILSKLIPKGVYLSSIVVGRDPRVEDTCAQQKALQRALVDRITHCWNAINREQNLQTNIRIPTVTVAESVFASGKAAKTAWALDHSSSNVTSSSSAQGVSDKDHSKTISSTNGKGENHHSNQMDRKRKHDELSSAPSPRGNDDSTPRKKKISPCGVSMNWQQPAFSQSEPSSNTYVELVVGARGICQGKKPKSSNDFKKLASRLSRTKLAEQQLEIFQLQLQSNTDSISIPQHPSTYQELKERCCSDEYAKLKALVLTESQTSPLNGWLIRNPTEHDFELKK